MIRRLWGIFALPLIGLAVSLSLYAVWYFVDLPPEETLVRVARNYFERYGLATVLFGAIVEGLLLIGWYFPGSLVIVLGLMLAGQDVLRIATVALAAVIGLVTAYVINFYVGKHGWYRLFIAFGLREPLENAQRRLTKHGVGAIFTTYWQANLASLTSTAAGILHFPFLRFFLYSLAATVLWLTFWSVLIYLLGPAAMAVVGLRFFLILIAIWFVAALVNRLRQNRSRTKENS